MKEHEHSFLGHLRKFNRFLQALVFLCSLDLLYSLIALSVVWDESFLIMCREYWVLTPTFHKEFHTLNKHTIQGHVSLRL